MTLKGYTRFKCRICGKPDKRKAGIVSIGLQMVIPSFNDCCSEECFKKYNRKQELKATREKAKKEAEFITKVAKEVIKLQKKENNNE